MCSSLITGTAWYQVSQSQAGPGRAEAQKHIITFYRVKVRFGANEHAKLFRKRKNVKKFKMTKFVLSRKIMFCWILANRNIKI